MTVKKPWTSTTPNSSEPKFHGTPIIEDKHGKILRPITRGQQYLLEAIEQNDIIFVNGPAGCGKSAIATWYGIAGIDSGEYDNLVLTRPILEAGENLGFLPGTFEEKVAPYMQPLYDFISMIKGPNPISAGNPKDHPTQYPVSTYKKKKAGNYKDDKYKTEYAVTPVERKSSNEDFYKKVNVCPLAYLRGTTKSRSFMLLDEAQNTTKQQMQLLLTRMGQGSKLVITGDIAQSDLERKSDSVFRHAQQILKGVHGIAMVTLGIEDICRHKLVKDIIIRYSKSESAGYDKSMVVRHRPEEYDFDSDNIDGDIDEDISEPKNEANINHYAHLAPPKVTKLPKKGLKKIIIQDAVGDDKFDKDKDICDDECIEHIESEPIDSDK